MRKIVTFLLIFLCGDPALATNGDSLIASIQEVPFIALIEGEVMYRPVMFNGVIIDVNLILTLSPYCGL